MTSVGGAVVAGVVTVVGAIRGNRRLRPPGAVQSATAEASGGLQGALRAAILVAGEAVRGGLREQRGPKILEVFFLVHHLEIVEGFAVDLQSLGVPEQLDLHEVAEDLLRSEKKGKL